MATIKVRGCEPDLIVPRAFIDKYMLTASGDHIKVYLLLLSAQQSGRDFDIAEAADLMDTTEKDIKRSLTYWEKQGVLSLETEGRSIVGISFANVLADRTVLTTVPKSGMSKALPVSGSNITEASQFSSSNIAEASQVSTATEAKASALEEADESDDEGVTMGAPRVERTVPIVLTPEMIAAAEANPDFKDLANVTQAYAKKLLKPDDYELLVRFFYRMNKSLDICELIVAHLADKDKLTLKAVDRLSCECIEKGYTEVQSIRYFLNQERISSEIIDILGLTCKKLPAAKMAFLNKWFLEYHFSENMVKEACNRGALQTDGGNCFPYIDSILAGWYQKGYTKMDDVTKADEQHKAEQKQKYGNKTKKATTNKFNDIEKREIDFSAEEAEFMTMHIKKKQ